jgi:hypothetical protein
MEGRKRCYSCCSVKDTTRNNPFSIMWVSWNILDYSPTPLGIRRKFVLEYASICVKIYKNFLRMNRKPKSSICISCLKIVPY